MMSDKFDPRSEWERAMRERDKALTAYARAFREFQETTLELLDARFDIVLLLEEPQRSWFAEQQKLAFDYNLTPKMFVRDALAALCSRLPHGVKK